MTQKNRDKRRAKKNEEIISNKKPNQKQRKNNKTLSQKYKKGQEKT
jgi:hypothetical protein